MKTHRIQITIPKGSGRRLGWVKKINSVDTDKRNGYAFDGPFLNDGWNDLETGAILIQCSPTGSVKHPGKMGEAFEVGPDGELKAFAEVGDWFGPGFLDFRDAVAEKLRQPPVNPLAEFSTEELRAELERRESDS